MTRELVQSLIAQGLSPLPVAPAQDAELYPARDKDGAIRCDKEGKPLPAFTGKNPSFLKGLERIPTLINHRQYQNRQPSEKLLKVWFEHPETGGGCLGSKHHRFVDIDTKHFDLESECDRVVLTWFAEYPALEGVRTEKTQSGGWRIWVYFETPPEFTNFSFSEGGPHVGEILGEGRFAVLAPTIGPSGRAYEVIQDGGFAQVESAEAVGLYATAAKKSKNSDGPEVSPASPAANRKTHTGKGLEGAGDTFASPASPAPSRRLIPGTIPLELLAKDSTRGVLNGQGDGDRSKDLTAAFKEWQGWQNWCSSQGVAYSQTAHELVHRAGVALGVDSARVDRIIETINLDSCHPACVHQGGDDSAWKRVKKLDPESYKALKALGDNDPKPSDKSSDKPRLDIYAGQIDQAAHTVLAHFGSAADPRERIYAQGNSQGYILVRVLKTITGIEGRYLHVSKDNDVLDVITPESLQWEINRAFEVYRWGEKNGEPEERRVDCPATLPKQILAMGRWPQLPILRGLSYTPLLTKTGEVIAQSGYHEGTGYLLQFDPTDYSLKQNPNKEDAIAALLTLKDLLSEFCFKTDVDRSAALSLLLTAISRKLYPLAPLHAVNAHQPGTGKGTLINLACILATGNKEAGAASFTDNEEEMSKKVLSTLLSGTPIVNIDNVDRRLGGGTLERVLTAEFYKDRILGVSKNAVCSTQVLWTANGNNLAFTTDMTRRTVLIELDAGIESPETRTFSRDIEAYALENRGELVSAALTVLQAYLKAGSPVPTDKDCNPINPPPLGSFGGWDAVVRRSLLWLGEPDPVQSQATIRDGDDSRIALASLLEAWHSQLGENPMQVRDVVQRAIATDGDFKHAVLEVCLDRQGQPSTKLMGYYLRRINGVVVNGYRLIRGTRMNSGFPWKVEEVQPKENKHERPEPSTPSTLSTPQIAKTIDVASVEVSVDKNGIYTDETKGKTDSTTEGSVDQSSTLHLHQPKKPAESGFQALLDLNRVDGVDGSSPSEFFADDDDIDWEVSA